MSTTTPPPLKNPQTVNPQASNPSTENPPAENAAPARSFPLTPEFNNAIHQRVDAAVNWTKRAVRILSADNAKTAWTLYRHQSNMVFPGSHSQGKAIAWVDAPSGADMLRFPTADGHHVAALFGRACNEDGSYHIDASTRPTVLYFYGSEMTCKTSLEAFQNLRCAGLNVLMPEYLGYGLSSGPATEAGCYATADAAYEHLLGRVDIDRARIVAVGCAMGGAIAIDLGARRTLAGIISLGAFTSLRDIIALNHPDLPTAGLLRHHFDALRKITKVDWPTLLIHSLNDATIPHQMAETLAAASRARAQRLDLHGDTPGQFLIYRDSDALRALTAYAESLTPVMPPKEESTATSAFNLARNPNLFAARNPNVRAAG